MTPTPQMINNAVERFSANSSLPNPDEKTIHTYTDAVGNPLFWRIRLKRSSTGEKWIRPFYFNGERFQLGEPPFPDAGKPLYALRQLTTRPDALVWIVEGEKAADALNRAFNQWHINSSHVAITSGGVGSVYSTDWTPVAGRHIAVWPDNDNPGAQFAMEVIERLRGIAGTVVLLDVSTMDLPPKGDAFDWLSGDGANIGVLSSMLDAGTMNPTPHLDKSAQSDDASPITSPLEQADDENQELQREIDELVSLPLLKYERTFKDVAKRIGIRAAVLDKLVQAERMDKSEASREMFSEVEPWTSQVNAGEVLSELSAAFRRYAVLPEYADDALALWCTFTWFCEVSHIAPLLVIRSPEKGCGKTTVLSIVKRVVYRPLVLSGISPAVLYRVADKYRPTFLIDEGDTFLNAENQDLHGIINCGYSKDAPYIWRCVGDEHEPKSFNVFSPKAIAFIGHSRDTLHDRAVEVALRRKTTSEKVSRLRHGDGGELDILARKLARLAADEREIFAAIRPHMPESLPDRQADNFEPLIAVAMLAGDEWVERGRVAALGLTRSKAQSAQISLGVELLTDIRNIFENRSSDKIRPADLVKALCDDPEGPWERYNRGKQITARQVTKRLGDYGIKTTVVRDGYDIFRGYKKSQFEDAFARYGVTLPEDPEENVTTSQSSNSGDSSVTNAQPVALLGSPLVTRNSNDGAGCNNVTGSLASSGTASQRAGQRSYVRI